MQYENRRPYRFARIAGKSIRPQHHEARAGKGLLEVQVHPLRKWAVNKYGMVDDYQYGGGAGMVMMCEPLANAIDELQSARPYDEIIYMTPDGERFNQKTANQLSLKENLLIICGHYKGIDERIREHYVTKEISIGDYVLSGGELAAAVVVDAVGRLLPGVLNDETSALTDSFRTTCWRHPYIPGPPISADGKCRTSCYRAILRKWKNGGMNNHCSAQKKKTRLTERIISFQIMLLPFITA